MEVDILKATQQHRRTEQMPIWVFLDGGAHWRPPANEIEPFVCGGDAALCQITLSTGYYGRPM